MDWYEEIYVKNAKAYQPVLEAGLKTAPAEARSLARIFVKYGIKKGFRHILRYRSPWKINYA